jgi:ribosome-binding factor A
MPTRRQERVSERIHEEISELLQTRVRDPRLAQVTVTSVAVSADLKVATIYVSSLGDRDACDNSLKGLQHAAGFLRRELAHQLQMRYTPELHFVLDESWERGARIDELLEQLPSSSLSDESADENPLER